MPGFDPDLIVYKEIKVVGALGVDTRSYKTAINLLQSGLYPFVDLTRQTAGFDDVEALVQAMAGESSDPPPVHAVFTP